MWGKGESQGTSPACDYFEDEGRLRVLRQPYMDETLKTLGNDWSQSHMVVFIKAATFVSIGQNRRSGSECLGFYVYGIGIYEVVLESVRLFIPSHMYQGCWLIV